VPALTAERRDRAAAELCEHFAAGHLELEALEQRLAEVDAARSESQLAELVAGLPALPAVVPAVEPPAARGWALAVMGGASRKGAWRVPRSLHAVALMGGVELDFRDARLGPGETHVTAVAVMGGIEIVVPPGLPVTVRGIGVLGAVDQGEHTEAEPSAGAPRLKVTALAVMGGIEVKTRASVKAGERGGRLEAGKE
jgi:hypothetical protein